MTQTKTKFQAIASSAFLLASLALLSTGCSKDATTAATVTPQSVETFPLENTVLTGCDFQTPNPTYAFNSTIAPNPIVCKAGVARTVTLISPGLLPSGLKFDPTQLSLVGVANEKMVAVPYTYYVENEAGYIILKLTITIK
jgi:hypothetical protein